MLSGNASGPKHGHTMGQQHFPEHPSSPLFFRFLLPVSISIIVPNLKHLNLVVLSKL